MLAKNQQEEKKPVTGMTMSTDEIQKQAEELIIANEKLAFENTEKEKRAAELILANTELLFQVMEKGNRAAELIIVNKELALLNEEKEKRAAELIIANAELVFQNKEKEKRAAELIERTDQLEAANKELESFSFSVSHDLRAPLRAVHGYANMLKRIAEGQLDTESNRLLNNILFNSKKMGQLIDELLNFSKLGRKELVMSEINMQNMVTNICDELAIEKANSHITFKIHNVLPCFGDTVTIKQVWVNLLSNAVKYSALKDKPVIEIASSSINNEIIYSVTDNGAGFDMRYAGKLFGVFQRLHSDEEFEGIGVGLAIVKRVITKHGGRVWAEGKVNEGASFHFTI